jgi:hypothetical protein
MTSMTPPVLCEEKLCPILKSSMKTSKHELDLYLLNIPSSNSIYNFIYIQTMTLVL